MLFKKKKNRCFKEVCNCEQCKMDFTRFRLDALSTLI